MTISPPQLSARAWLLDQLTDDLLCVDVGARWGADEAFGALAPRSRVLCFEPDAEECDRLQADAPPTVTYVPLALASSERRATLHVTEEPACSSLHEPDPVLASAYPALSIIRTRSRQELTTTSLAAYLDREGLGSPDLYKLDTQGSELDILRGAGDHLAAASMIDVEVQFTPLYRGSATFGEIDVFLRRGGFGLWRLPLLAHYAPRQVDAASSTITTVATPPGTASATAPGNGQLFWAQAHYVNRRLVDHDDTRPDPDEARRGAAVASAYGHWDLALMALARHPDTRAEAAELDRLLTR